MRKRARRIERVERIAASVFAEKGYEGANFELIAAELDLRGPSLYHYFSSKEELFLRCVRRSAEEVFTRLRTIADNDLDAVGKLRALFREQVLIEVRDYPEFVPLFFKTYVPVPELRAEILRLRRTHASIFERVAETVRDRSDIDSDDIRVWLSAAFGALAYLPEWYDPHGSLDVERLADKLADTLADPFLRRSRPPAGHSARTTCK
jgi:AcrR family transcriptional regulator